MGRKKDLRKKFSFISNLSAGKSTEEALEELDDVERRSDSSTELPSRLDPDEFTTLLRTNYEIVDLENAEKQAKVLIKHIQELKMKKPNETVDSPHTQKPDVVYIAN